MGNTYSRIVLHLVFAVRHREALIKPEFREELQMVMSGLVRHRGQKLLAIYCMPDHAHLLISYRPSIPIPELVMQIKVASMQFVREKRLTQKPFQWQNGYGVISCNADRLDGIIAYINNQEEHHRKKKFLAEYREMLDKFEIKYEERYLFDDLSESA